MSVLNKRLVFIYVLLSILFTRTSGLRGAPNVGRQKWSYVEVREGAFMFWWLYYTSATEDHTKRPWVIWLQGGPGASSTGYGNFEEIGPIDSSLKNRTHNWVQEANVLFIDNPVGAGFSYVKNTSLLVTNNTQIAEDLLVTVSKFLEKVPDFQTIPLYIFSESYGGKMAAQFALRLYKQISKGKLKCNLKGVNLGDSWISPIDSVLTWAPFLFSTSLVDNRGFSAVNTSAYAVREALERGQFKLATKLWDDAEEVMSKHTNGVDVYNILETHTPNLKNYLKSVESPKNSGYDGVASIVDSMFLNLWDASGQVKASLESGTIGTQEETMRKIGKKHLRKFHTKTLSDVMNGPVKQMLRIIPQNVTWGAQSEKVFAALAEDFMKPVVHVVENLLNNTPIAVNVYNGQLDLIVDTMGTLNWVEALSWSGTQGWSKADRKSIVINNSTEMFVTKYKNFGFYWVLKAGHMVPADAPLTAIEMLKLITSTK